jgi:hypothetical protein
VTDAVPLVLAGLAVAAIAGGALLVRASGADSRTGRRLAGARPTSIPDLRAAVERGSVPSGPVRLEGRVRCADPIHTPAGDRVALLHRDVEVELADGQWRTIERLRDSRPIDLWERTASVPLDLAEVREPLITIPHLWEGTPDELDTTYQPAVQRLAAEHGPPRGARATTRQVTLVDQLTVLAVPVRGPDGGLRLEPPNGGFVAATVDLDVAMRLLAGPHRRRMLAGYGLAAVGLVLIAGAAIAGLASLLA